MYQDKTATLLPETSGVDALAQLALNLRWSWNHTTDELWDRLDPKLWELTRNPWLILQTISQDKLNSVLSDPVFRQRISDLLHENQQALTSLAWFQREHPDSPLTAVAYFSMEFMLSEALPIYSGGLGNVAGDQLKAASNLGVPVIGVGLLYDQGYFRQEIDPDGFQQALYPFNDPGLLPITPLRQPNGEWLRLQIDLPGSKLWIRTWEVRVGRRKLYLLDTNDPANLPSRRSITGQLYGGDAEMRLKQELVLGVGGWRLLRAIGLEPDVCHLNEGHAAFAILERARSYMEDHHTSFELALTITRAGNLFTTHTAVPAGFDRFAPELASRYLIHYAEKLGISLESLLALGRQDPRNRAEPFNMAYLAMRGSGAVNGVSKLHGKVSRRIFEPLFSRWPESEVPVSSVTNGVHMPTWSSIAAEKLWNEACGGNCWRDSMDDFGRNIRSLSNTRIWQLRTDARRQLVSETRKRLARQLAEEGIYPNEGAHPPQVFDPETLTLGFARRFATYKRPNLLLHDPERLIRILCDHQRPVQLVLAGKAHPQDQPGQALIKQWNDFVRRSEVRTRVVFLSDYDMSLTQQLAEGVDLWINTPRRPWEACGTSGMKLLANGGLNVSELDGWWAEAYTPEVGWALGDGLEHDSDPAWDAAEADALYTILEQQVVPEFYDRNRLGMPVKWVARIRESMARLTPEFSASRAIFDYTDKHYIPAAASFKERSAQNGALGAELLEWQHQIAAGWHRLAFGQIEVESNAQEHIFRVQVTLGDLSPQAVQVELFANGHDGEPLRQPMRPESSGATPAGESLYVAKVPAARPPSDYTPRIVSYHPKASIPLEAPEILWQH